MRYLSHLPLTRLSLAGSCSSAMIGGRSRSEVVAHQLRDPIPLAPSGKVAHALDEFEIAAVDPSCERPGVLKWKNSVRGPVDDKSRSGETVELSEFRPAEPQRRCHVTLPRVRTGR